MCYLGAAFTNTNAQMKKLIVATITFAMITACNNQPKQEATAGQKEEKFEWQVDQFEDIRVLRYQVPGWDQLSAQQRMLVYHLGQAGLSGRDMMWDMNYRHNLKIRRALESILKNYTGDKNEQGWLDFMTYAKRVFFATGIHHHYSNAKMMPTFSRAYFEQLLAETNTALTAEVIDVIFDPEIDAKKVVKSGDGDLLQQSAVNFYAPDVTQAEAEAFYAAMIDTNDTEPISYGLNSTLERDENGDLFEAVWYADGKYGSAIREIINHLEAAKQYAENDAQAEALGLLIAYYRTGDLKKWDEYNIAWVQATEGDVDYINGFVEVYNDPLGYRGSYETIVQIKDFEATERMAVVADNVQWFEDNSPIMDEHKKESVTGVTYKMVTVAAEAGDASPSTPIGVNLPNANWIRVKHGSKSVSLANIEHAYHEASGAGFLEEFAFSSEEVERGKKYGTLAGAMHTALHEVVGHASGQINPGVGTPKETLKQYASTLEEARADLVALYYIMDPKMQEIGLMQDDGAGKAEYDGYIRNGMMLQLRRIKPGDKLEQDHMRNRQLVASWAYERGMEENVIEKKVVQGKTYFVINDYDKLRGIFGELLREIQRIKSEGDFAAGKALVEGYGVQVDPAIHAEVLERSAKLNIAPYSGFVNPVMKPVTENGEMVDVEITFPTDFIEQMLYYGERYSFLN
jgi:dipeptidyl-peptidase-3